MAELTLTNLNLLHRAEIKQTKETEIKKIITHRESLFVQAREKRIRKRIRIMKINMNINIIIQTLPHGF